MRFKSLDRPVIYILLLIVAMFSIQSGASLAKSLFSQLGPAGVTSLRIAFAAIILLLIFKPWRFRLSRESLITIILYGASLGFMNLLFYFSLQRIPLGIVVAIEFIGPLTIALVYIRKLKDLIWVVFAIIGILLLLPLNTSASGLDWLGVAYALAAGVCWAMYILFGQKLATTIPSGVATSYGMVAAALLIMPIGLVSVGTDLFTLELLPVALLVAVLSSALPYSLEMMALTKIPKQSFSIMMSLEPAVAALSGLLFLKEQLTGLQWLAITLVIIASIGTASIGSSPAIIPKD